MKRLINLLRKCRDAWVIYEWAVREAHADRHIFSIPSDDLSTLNVYFHKLEVGVLRNIEHELWWEKQLKRLDKRT